MTTDMTAMGKRWNIHKLSVQPASNSLLKGFK